MTAARFLQKQALFWLVIGGFLLANLPRLLQNPNAFADSTTSAVIITEFLARNQTGLVDDEADPVDWIEIYNQSARPVNLEGWSLTDNPDLPAKWLFPAVTLPAQHYLVVYASGKNGVTLLESTADATGEGVTGEDLIGEDATADRVPLPILHTNFRLNGTQGFLALYPPTTRRFLDSVGITYGPQQVDVSYGRLPDDNRDTDNSDTSSASSYYFFTVPTPGAANDPATAQPPATAPVQFSVAHGLYDEPFSLTLTSDTPGAQLWYTTDGRVPTPETAQLYAGPIAVTTTTVIRAIAAADGESPSAPVTQSYLFPTAVLTQPADPPGMPATWGTHRISFAGATAGEPVQADYAMDPRIAQDAAAQPQLLAGLRALPSLALTLPPEHFTELYSDPQHRGVEAEYGVSVELLPTDGESGFQIDAGVRIQGGAGRWEYMPKHSFRLFFKGMYGATQLPYPIFPDSPVAEFDTLVLRAGVDRNFAGDPNTPDLRQTTYARDEWARATQIAMSGVGAHGRFVHLYINGLYWGLYNVVERPDASFAAAYYGGNKDEWATVNHGGAVSGQFDRFGNLIRLAQEGGLADPAKYATMLEFIDPVQFSDYLILNWYAGNSDWPTNNWYVNVGYPAGRNLFFAWDAEMTWDAGALLQLGVDQVEGAPFPNVIKLVFQALMESPDYRLLLADRLYHHLAEGGALTPAAAQTRWRQVTAPLTNAIVAESARWGDGRYAEPITQADWLAAVANVATQMETNDQRLLEIMRAAGYYPPIDPPRFEPPNQPGSTFPDTLALAMQTAQGEIFYTLDGSDPRAAGSGAVATTATAYTSPLLLTTATTVKARSRLVTETGIIWSALLERTFVREGQRADVRISEIMYHAQGGAEYEYLELKNMGDLPADLSRAYFTGIDFHFPVGATLAPGQHFTLIRDYRKFRERYAEAEFNAVYGGELSNYGEMVALHAANGTIITSVTYSPANGWPVTAAGQGDAVVLFNIDGDPDVGSSWRAGTNLYGSPGEDDP